MDKVILGKTELEVNKNGFGALPIQRIKTELEVNKNGFGALPIQRITKKEAV